MKLGTMKQLIKNYLSKSKKRKPFSDLRFSLDKL